MTYEEKIRELLSADGLRPEHRVGAVIERCKADDLLKDTMCNRWGDAIEEYTESVLAALWISVRRITVEYIDEVIPLAFFRPMFAD